MSKHESPEEKNNELSKLGYEVRDFKTKNIVGAIVAFFIFTTLCIGVAWVIINMFIPGYEETPKHLMDRQIPNSPKLQTNVTAVKDIRDLREYEHKMLSSYGWVDQGAGIVRIPIERAMELTLAKGLPTSASKPKPDPESPTGDIMNSCDEEVQNDAQRGDFPTVDPMNKTNKMGEERNE